MAGLVSKRNLTGLPCLNFGTPFEDYFYAWLDVGDEKDYLKPFASGNVFTKVKNPRPIPNQYICLSGIMTRLWGNKCLSLKISQLNHPTSQDDK
jgi:hypothetical protein